MRARRGRLAQRGRCLFAWMVGIFLLLQLTAGLLLDYCWPLLRFPSAAKILGALPPKPAADIVFLGSSRFECGIAPEEIGRLLQRDCQTPGPVVALNAAVPAGDAITAELLLEQLLARGIRPRLVVVEVSPETLSCYNYWLKIHVTRQLRWHELPDYFVDVCRVGWALMLAQDRFFPLCVHRQQLWQALVRAWRRPAAPPAVLPSPDAPPAPPVAPVDWDSLLQVPCRPLPPERWQIICSSAEQLPGRWLRRFRIGGTAVAALERLLSRCRQENSRVLLVAVPVTTPHNHIYTPEIDKEFLAYLEQTCQQFGCRFVDYRRRIPDTLFVDTHHLDSPGRLYFSRLLTHEVLAPFWRTVGP